MPLFYISHPIKNKYETLIWYDLNINDGNHAALFMINISRMLYKEKRRKQSYDLSRDELLYLRSMAMDLKMEEVESIMHSNKREILGIEKSVLSKFKQDSLLRATKKAFLLKILYTDDYPQPTSIHLAMQWSSKIIELKADNYRTAKLLKVKIQNTLSEFLEFVSKQATISHQAKLSQPIVLDHLERILIHQYYLGSSKAETLDALAIDKSSFGRLQTRLFKKFKSTTAFSVLRKAMHLRLIDEVNFEYYNSVFKNVHADFAQKLYEITWVTTTNYQDREEQRHRLFVLLLQYFTTIEFHLLCKLK